MGHSIPLIDIGPLFGMRSFERDLIDQAIIAAAATSGFMVVGRLPPDVPAGRAARADLLRLFVGHYDPIRRIQGDGVAAQTPAAALNWPRIAPKLGR